MRPTTMSRTLSRRLPIGAEVQPDGSTHFRVWAPSTQQVAVTIDRVTGGRLTLSLDPETHGYHSGWADCRAGDRYQCLLDGVAYADPASRWQPEGVHGPSVVVDPSAYHWFDDGWSGVRMPGQVLYEMHIGTFTAEGTWRAAAEKLPHLVETGVTVLEVMPVSTRCGSFSAAARQVPSAVKVPMCIS